MNMTYYISGPMRGVRYYNFPAFEKAAKALRAEGHTVISPAEDDAAIGLDPMALPNEWDWSRLPAGFGVGDFADRDIESIKKCDGIYMLPGWRSSKGALAEYHLADWLGLYIVDPEGGVAAQRKQVPLATGLCDYFPDALRAIAHCSWVGNSQHQPGEPLHWAREKSNDHPDCMMRHFMERGTVDEDGVRHVVKAAWRMLALAQLELEAADEC